MQNLRIDEKHEFEQEKGAVINELLRNEDQPWDLEQKAILPLLFGKEAPYGHPVIGERKHVEDATAEIIIAHYNKWYHPNNAALVIVGGFDADEALKADQGAVRPPFPRPNCRAQAGAEGIAEAAGRVGHGVEVRRAADADGLQRPSAPASRTTRCWT